MKELKHSPNTAVSKPLSSIPTITSLKFMAQRELTQLPNAFQDLLESSLLQYYWAQDKEKHKQPTDDSDINPPQPQIQ